MNAHHNPSSPFKMFLGHTPEWYKKTVLAALVLNVVFYFVLGPLLTSWIILLEFIGTLVGEPENIVIGTAAGWDFMTFIRMVSPATIPTLFAGFLTCLVIEKMHWFGYGAVASLRWQPAAADTCWYRSLVTP